MSGMTITKEELVRRINLAKAAVDASALGPMFLDANQEQAKIIAVQTYYAVLGALLPHHHDSSISVKRDKEPWEGE